jgi:hypothetical protein
MTISNKIFGTYSKFEQTSLGQIPKSQRFGKNLIFSRKMTFYMKRAFNLKLMRGDYVFTHQKNTNQIMDTFLGG